MAYVKSEDNLSIYYEYIKGKKNKPTLFFVHGWAVDWSYFKLMIGYLSTRGYSIVYFDIRGHGQSDTPKSLENYDFKYVHKDMELIRKELKLKKLVLIGHSMGGMIATTYAINYQKYISHLIVVDSTYQTPLKSEKILYFNKHHNQAKKLCDLVLGFTKPRKKTPKMSANLEKYKNSLDILIFLKGLSVNTLNNCFSYADIMMKYAPEEDLYKIEVPTFIIGSSDDHLFSVKTIIEFSKRIRNSRFYIIEGTHAVIVKKPIQVANLIENFITKH